VRPVAQLVASVAGGSVGGALVLLGVNAQFARQSKAACEALLVEVKANYEALDDMLERKASDAGWEAGITQRLSKAHKAFRQSNELPSDFVESRYAHYLLPVLIMKASS